MRSPPIVGGSPELKKGKEKRKLVLNLQILQFPFQDSVPYFQSPAQIVRID